MQQNPPPNPNQDNTQEVHGILMTIAWFLLENIGIWSLYFKSNPYSLYIHALCMGMIGFITALGPMLMIGLYGPSIILASVFHQIWGFVLYLTLPFLLISGSICLITKLKPNIRPQLVRFRTIAHSIFGWVFILLIKVPLSTGWYGGITGTSIFGFIILFDFTSYGFYFYLKFKKAKIQQIPSPQMITKQLGIRKVESMKELKIYSTEYFIFQNKVYDINQILSNHPGGWTIIQQMKGRQVDRFLYGVDPIQFYDVPRHPHSFKSINLAGPPIAVLNIPQAIRMQLYNKARVEFIYCHDKKMKIHTVYLQLLRESSQFRGYTDVRQIGQYYSLTINNKKTRLYTVVNFLQPENINLLIKISKGKVEINKRPLLQLKRSSSDDTEHMDLSMINSEKEHKKINIVPLLMKKYDDGYFTSQFLSSQKRIHEVIISQPRGLGLSFDCLTATEIVLIAGGTGLYPFSDLIDLLYKSFLIQNGHEMISILRQSNPVLKNSPFQNFKFSVYLAVNELEELHPITLYQCNQLSSSKYFKCYAKVKGSEQTKLKESYPNIVRIEGRFEGIINRHFKDNENLMFYTCGPVRFTKSLVNQFKKIGVPPTNYCIV